MVKINGAYYEHLEGMTFSEYLIEQGIKNHYIAIECNGTILPKNSYSTKKIEDGDSIELVQFVGGG